MLSDLAQNTAIELPTPSAHLRSTLEPLLQQGSSDNPLDMGGIIGGAHRFGEVVDACCRSGDFDVVLAVSTAYPPAHTAARVESLVSLDASVPIVHLWMAGDVGADGLAALRAVEAPVTEEPRAAIKALAALVERCETAADVDLTATPIPSGPRTEHAAKLLVSSWGMSVVSGQVATSAAEAAATAERLGYPVVVKISSSDIVHKTELGGVIVGVVDEASVRSAFDQVIRSVRLKAPAAAIDGVLVEKQLTGPEIILGAVSDPTFGPMILVGLGGVVAEALDDARMAPAPVAATHARKMIDSLVGLKLLTHPRTGSPADLDALAELVVALGDRMAAQKSVHSIDLNPIVWSGGAWVAVDAVVDAD